MTTVVPSPAHSPAPLPVPEAGASREERLARLHAEQARLVQEELRVAAELAALEGAPLAPPSVAPPPFAPPSPVPPAAAARAARRPVRLQTLLLGAGALLLVIAAIVFAAVAWDRLGATGQITLLVVVVGVLSAAAYALRTGYRATAETLAAIAAAVAAVAAVAAPRLGLGADWMRDRPAVWVALALLGVAVLVAVLGLLSRLVAWRVATVAALTVSAFSASMAFEVPSGPPQPLAIAAIAAVAAVLVSATAPASARTAPASTDLRATGLAFGGLATLLALGGYDNSLHAPAWVLTWTAVAAFLLVATARYRVALLAAATGLAAGHVPVFVAAALAPASASNRSDGGDVVSLPSALPALLVLAAVGTLTLLAVEVADRRLRSDLAPLGLRAAAGATWALAIPMLDDGGRIDARQYSVYLGVVAIVLLGTSAAFLHAWAAWIGGAVGCLAVWAELSRYDVQPFEWRTLPAAAVLLVAGLVVLRARLARGRSADSLFVLGPALTLGLLPSAIGSVEEAVHGGWAQRGVIVLVVAVLIALVGLALRLRGPVVVGLVTAAVAAVGQAWAVADLVPRWVSLATLGVLLVAAGFALEALARAGRRARHSLTTLR